MRVLNLQSERKTMRDSIVFYRSYYNAIIKLPEENREEALITFLDYAFNDTIREDMSPVVEPIFILAKETIDASKKRYLAAVENGKKGGRPRKSKTEKTTSKTPEKTTSKKPQKTLANAGEKTQQNLNVYVNENVNENENADVDVYDYDDAVAFASENRKAGFSSRTNDDDKTTKAILVFHSGDVFHITQKDLNEWHETYPTMDVTSELKKMQEWLTNHPDKQDFSGARHYIVSWLKRAAAKENENAQRLAQWTPEYEAAFQAAIYRGEEEDGDYFSGNI